jgi:hypothetical protein
MKNINLAAFFLLFFAISGFAQDKEYSVKEAGNGFVITLDFSKGKEKSMIDKKLNCLEFTEYQNESLPGAPILPSRTYYIAIPPYSKISAVLKNKKYNVMENTKPAVNKKAVMNSDSTISYDNVEISNKFLTGDTYPQSDIEILGYTVLRDYYCAIVKVNTYLYNWKKNSISQLISASLSISYSPNSGYIRNSAPQGVFDKDLNNVICNYNEAQNFRFPAKSVKSDTSGSWIDYNRQYVKLNVASDGIFRITYDDLVSYGLSPQSINPTALKIYLKGSQLPIYVAGEQDGVFNTNDYIEFWAEKNYNSKNYRQIVTEGSDYINYMDRYTDTASYWLQWEGENGLRTKSVQYSITGLTDSIVSGLAKTHMENDVLLWTYDNVTPRVQLPFWQECKKWSWSVLGPGNITPFTFSASNIVANTKVNVIARITSYASNLTSNAHKAGLSLNSTSIRDTIIYDYKATKNFSAEYPSSLLQTGTNTIRLFGIATASNPNQTLVDWVDADYFRYNYAQNDSLKIIIPDTVTSALRIVKINNIAAANENILVYKIKPVLEKMDNLVFSGTGNKTVLFADTVHGGDIYWVCKIDYIKHPSFRYKKTFANLRNTAKGADYLIISNKVLQSSANSYKDYITSLYGIRTELVFVDDIFDEFSYGYMCPEALQSFTSFAYYNWTAPKPSYLLLLGHANYDYRNIIFTTLKRENLVPTYGDPVSDTYYTMFDTASINMQQMYVGRIPANNNSEVLNYLGKIQLYNTRGYDIWNKSTLFFSGGDVTYPSELQLIKQANDTIINSSIKTRPFSGFYTHFYKTINPATDLGPYTYDQIQNAINAGGLFISYVGHSGTRTWDNGINRVVDLRSSHNDRMPLISDFGCSTGKYAEPDVDSFGELFICQDPDGQAINYLGNSSFGFLSTSLRFPKYFYDYYLQDTLRCVGQIHFLAKMKQINITGLTDVNRVFNYCNLLFGDPIVRMPIPTKVNYHIENSFITLTDLKTNELKDSVILQVRIQNLGLALKDSLSVKYTDTYRDSNVVAKYVKIKAPMNEDTLYISIPTKRLPGEHLFAISLDYNNETDEIYENDNDAQLQFTVYSATARNIISDRYFSTIKQAGLLNPFNKINGTPERYSILIADNPKFNNGNSYTKDYDTLYSKFILPQLSYNKRYWLKAKIDDPNFIYMDPISFTYLNNDFTWYVDSLGINNDLVNNSISYLNSKYDSVKKAFKIADTKNELKIVSAGSMDGKYASVKFNGIEQLYSTFFWGVATMRLDSTTLKPYESVIYHPLEDSTFSVQDLIDYINLLPAGEQLIITACDDAVQSVLGWSAGTPVRNAIKQLGSHYIDSVGYRESWCIIGKKGAPEGSVPELYSKQGMGAVIIDTVKQVLNSAGSIGFPVAGNSGSWKSIVVSDSIPSGSQLNYYPVGIKTNGQTDTLAQLVFNNEVADISNINSKTYPSIKVVGKMKANSQHLSPLIYSIGINYLTLPELAVNYQTVSINKDSLMQGDSLIINYKLANLGGIKTDSFYVYTYIIKSNNQAFILDSNKIALDSNEYKNLRSKYISRQYDGYGDFQFQIKIDPQNVVNELYKDNNIYTGSFKIIKDTTTSVSTSSIYAKFDSKEIIDQDYVADNPKLDVQVNYPVWFPGDKQNAINVMIDNQPIDSQTLHMDDDTVNRKLVLSYSPKFTAGEHKLDVYTINAYGKMDKTPGLEKYFTVSDQLSLNDVYNYPNPFKNNTAFTFFVTQKPDELKIRIFTVAGRLIKEISVPADKINLNTNFYSWDGKDADGNDIANGVYLYKVIIKKNGKTDSVVKKLAKIK